MQVSQHTSSKYPGWTFEKTVKTIGDRTQEEWFGTKKGVGYAVFGIKCKDGKVYGELMTRQKGLTGSISWEPIKSSRNPFEGEMSDCIKEAEKRAEYWQQKNESNVYGDRLKLA